MGYRKSYTKANLFPCIQVQKHMGSYYEGEGRGEHSIQCLGVSLTCMIYVVLSETEMQDLF